MAGCKKLEVVSGPWLVLFADLKQIFPLNGAPYVWLLNGQYACKNI